MDIGLISRGPGSEFSVHALLAVGQKHPPLIATSCPYPGDACSGLWEEGNGILRACQQLCYGDTGSAPHPDPDANLLHWSSGPHLQEANPPVSEMTVACCEG